MYVYIVFCFLSPEKKCLMSYFAACKKIFCSALLMAHCEWKPSEPADFTNYSWLKPSLTWTLHWLEPKSISSIHLLSFRTHDNWNLPITGSNFCFPWDHSFIILPPITWTMFLASGKLEKKRFTEVRNIEFISKQPCQFFVFIFCLSSSISVSVLVY